MRRCPRTGKVGYRSVEQAKRALTLIRQSGDRREETPTRYYRCEFCHRWHLTKQDRHAPRPVTVPVLTEPREQAAGVSLAQALTDRATLERIIRRCIATNCGCCMHDPEWGEYRIRTELSPQQPTNNQERHHHEQPDNHPDPATAGPDREAS